MTNDKDKWLTLDTEPLKRLYGAVQEGDEIFCQVGWKAAIPGYKMRESSWGTFRRLRSKSWLKASEHPIRFPAYVCAPSGNVFYLATADNAPQTGTPAQWLWQPAPQLPEPPAKEDACEKAFERAVATFDHDAVMGKYGRYEWAAWQAFFKAGWEARGGK